MKKEGSAISGSDVIRLASANLLDGGVNPDAAFTRREQSVAALRDWRPHLVFIQELCAPGDEEAREHFQALAGALGMQPCALGLPRGSKKQRTGILADTSVLEILGDGPAPVRDAPYWAEAVIRIRATGTELYVISVHAPATTAVGQLTEAERLATRIAQRGMLAVAGGDWNCYSPACRHRVKNDPRATLEPKRWQGVRFRTVLTGFAETGGLSAPGLAIGPRDMCLQSLPA